MPTTALSLQVQPSTVALERIVSVCRRRNIEILALDYLGSEVQLLLGGESRFLAGIERWLSSLIDVHAVSAGEPEGAALPVKAA